MTMTHLEYLPARDSIAIIGIGCRFPGAHGPHAFWRLLLDAVDAVREVPADRSDGAGARPAPSGSGGARGERAFGGHLEKIDEFDADFFGMSPREARMTDPQARLLLETAWEAVEDAGLPPDGLAGSRTGVFVGQATSNYWDLLRRCGEPDIHAVVGGEVRATLPGRISFFFDLHGPSVSVDTACSASLTAVHVACQSLRTAESSVAIAAGVNLALLGDEGAGYARAGMLADDGRCKFGDARADGFTRSDGVGVVVLKPLQAALADGDRVYAVIRGSAINNDGRSSGLPMTPGVAGQEELLRLAYRDAGIAPNDVDYVEAHGTGTSAGDPVELTALANVLGEGRTRGHPCFVGSVKTNIGHTEAAAGIAGLIKAALCVYHRAVPASLHFRAPTPAVPWDCLPIVVPTRGQALPDSGRPAIAGVNSFGISGANAHLVLAEHIRRVLPVSWAVRPREAGPLGGAHPPRRSEGRRTRGSGGPSPGSRRPGRPHILPLSAACPEALKDTVRSIADFLGPDGPGRALGLGDICHTAAVRRKHHGSRLVVIGETHDQIAARLRDHLADRAGEGVVGRADTLAERPLLAFVFPGQGTQWAGMGRELLRTSEVFREEMRRCDSAIAAETGRSILRELEGADSSWMAEVDVLQPALWALQVSLGALWRSLGVEPDVVVGHSMGEVAAAHLAGALGRRDAAAIICRRSRLARRLSGQGAMAVVALSEEEAAEAIGDRSGEVSIAAINGPASSILSGAVGPLHQILSELAKRGVPGRLLKVDFASHSPQVDILADDLPRALSGIWPRTSNIPIHSTVTGTVLDGAELDAAYWVRNLRAPVRFAPAVTEIAKTAPTVFLEISPHPALVAAIRDVLGAGGLAGGTAGSLRRDEPAWPCLLESLAQIHVLGGRVDWTRLNGAGRCVSLPPYAWQHRRHWIEEQPADPAAAGPAGHDLDGGPALRSRAIEFSGALRIMDHGDRPVAELTGARLQFVIDDLSATPATIGVPAPRAAAENLIRHEREPLSDAPAAPASQPKERDITDEVADVLAFAVEEINTRKSLRAMGLDSLMAKYLVDRLRRNHGVDVSETVLLADQPLAATLDQIRAAPSARQ